MMFEMMMARNLIVDEWRLEINDLIVVGVVDDGSLRGFVLGNDEGSSDSTLLGLVSNLVSLFNSH